MKSLIFVIAILCAVCQCLAQKPREANPKARAYYDAALNKYAKNLGNPDSLKVILKLLDNAIKLDPQFYNAYSEKVAFLCQVDDYKHAEREIETMAGVFQKDIFVNLLCGAIKTKTGNSGAAVFYKKAIKLVDDIPQKLQKGDNYNEALSYKGIALILLGKNAEGRAILQNLYNNELNQMIKSRLAGYLNCTKNDQILENVLPGKWN